MAFTYCPQCAKPLQPRLDLGVTRNACPDDACGYTHWDNPTPVVAAVVEHEALNAELGRRVQRKLLTVLFGQSGLGKSSILQAGVFPRLRTDGFCPIYIRLDHADGAPSPTEQI